VLLIAFDGHDGAGKTTLAAAVAAQIGGTKVSPFGGTLGDFIAWNYRSRRYGMANDVALAAIRKALAEHDKAGALIFDRHWLSMFTVLPPRYRSSWRDRPFTILIWADPAATERRLIERGEAVDRPGNEYYCRVYRELAERYRVPMVDTTLGTLEENIARCRELIESLGPGRSTARR